MISYDPGKYKTSELRQQVLSLSVPAALEALLLGVIELVDVVMISFLDLHAVAAVGITSQPRRILLMFFTALNVGATALVSRRIGEKKGDEANYCMHQFILYCVLLAGLLYSLGHIFARPLLLLAGAGADYVEDAVIYFRILMVGQFFQAIGLTINACLRAAGKTRVSFQTNLIANLVNLVLNYLLIYGKFGFPRLEITGAAIATSVGCIASFLISLWTIRPKSHFVLKLSPAKRFWRPDLNLILSVRKVVESAFHEQFFHRLGLFLYARIAASLGTNDFALYNYLMNVANVQGYTYEGFAVTSTALTGQYLGAESPDRAKAATMQTLRYAYGTAAVITVMLCVFRTPILWVFSRDTAIVRIGSLMLPVIAVNCIPSAGAFTYAGALRGAGETGPVARYTLVSTAIVRPLLAWLLCSVWGIGMAGVWIAFDVGHILRWYLMRRQYRKGCWQDIRL